MLPSEMDSYDRQRFWDITICYKEWERNGSSKVQGTCLWEENEKVKAVNAGVGFLKPIHSGHAHPLQDVDEGNSTRVLSDFVPVRVKRFKVPGHETGQDFQVMDFHQREDFKLKKYTFFSSKSKMIQSDSLKSGIYDLIMDEKFFWLDVFRPSTDDYQTLMTTFGVNSQVIEAIKDGVMEEKMVPYRNFTLFVLKLEKRRGRDEWTRDPNLILLVFKEFVISLHKTYWKGQSNIISFVDLLRSHLKCFSPEWVIFATLEEIRHEMKEVMAKLRPQVSLIMSKAEAFQMLNVMGESFIANVELESALEFIEPKRKLLEKFKSSSPNRVSLTTIHLLSEVADDIQDQIHTILNWQNQLKMAKTNFTAVLRGHQGRVSNNMAYFVVRCIEFALIFFPMKVISSLLAMNGTDPTGYIFWIIVLVCCLIGIGMYFLRTKVFNTNRMKNRFEMEIDP